MAKKKETNKKGNIFLTILGTLMCIILIPILIVNVTLIVKSYTNKEEVPSFGSYIPMVVLTDSMYPVIESGDLIILKTIEPEYVKKGDIINFFDPTGNGTTTVTHRVIEVTEDATGSLAFRTKGDANNTDDKALVPAENVVGIYETRVPNVGKVAMFMSTTQGLIVCVGIPLILLVSYDFINRKRSDKKLQSDKEALLAEIERLKSEQSKKSE